VVVTKISSKYLRTIIAVIFLPVSVTNRAMSNPSVLPPYSESSKPTVEGTGPATGQVQYVQHPYIQPGSPVQYIQQPYTQPGGQVHIIGQNFIDPSTALIRDWLPWSIINIFIGWIFVAILPLIFSLLCRSYKRSNNARGAKTMGTFALIFNILVTMSGIAAWIALIAIIATANSISNCYYPYYC
jgi:hypothetical protein